MFPPAAAGFDPNDISADFIDRRVSCPPLIGPLAMHSPLASQTASLTELERLAEAPLPTRFGVFQVIVFRYRDPEAHPGLSDEHLALVMGDVDGADDVPVRVHSECLTSEVLGSLKCDCKEQLEAAQEHVAQRGRGVVLYLRQEGRGIGLANKIRAYALQAKGADTIEANELLHLPVDARQYDVAAEMLRALGVRSIELMTNNPSKTEALGKLGIVVHKRIPVHIEANEHSASYLSVKRERMRHQLPEVPPRAPSAKH
jgi:GTP cyclohydrolase II